MTALRFRLKHGADRVVDRAIGLIPWLIAGLFGGVAIHLILLLALPRLAPGSTYRKVALEAPLGQVELLPPAAPETPGPAFSDPFATLALCRFDLTQGPLRLRARADGDHPFAVSVRLADGTIIFSANDRQAPKGRFDILILTQAQADEQDLQRDNDETSEAAPQDQLRLISPGKNGFALVRALSLREGDYDSAAAMRSAIECSVEKPAP
ncbi:hypothetical protein [Rhodoblastus sp.]|uniref:hypothetical protein n=1 Tax=Rhodoblastus sp. TaxID=1962975 RepID=UPI003F9E768D